jgi:hypothetical protein
MRALLLAAFVVALGCNTPSVPIPPPLVNSLKFADGPTPGEVILNGTASPSQASARFYVYNATQGDGVITTAAADGSFSTMPFAGIDGDLVEIYYDTPAGEHSGVDCVTLHVGATLFTTLCQ